MMRLLLLSVFVTLSAGVAQAASNPWQRACRIESGVFWVLEGDNEYSMCFLGNSAIGAEDLFKFKTSEGETESIQAYRAKNYSSNLDSVCDDSGAEIGRAHV